MVQSWSMARNHSNGRFRWSMMWLGVTIVIVYFATVPLPYRIACRGSVQPADRKIVYTQSAGRITSHLSARNHFDNLKADDILVSLENPWLDDQLRLATQRQRQIELQIEALRQLAYQKPSIIDQIPTMTTNASIAEKQSMDVKREVDRLVITKPNNGTWLPIALSPAESLGSFTIEPRNHTVHDDESCGRWLSAGTPIGYIAATDHVSIVSNISVTKFNDVHLGMRSRVRFDQFPDCYYTAYVSKISHLSATPVEHKFQRATFDSGNDTTSEPSIPENRSLISVSFLVEGVTLRQMAMNGTAEIVIWSKPMSLLHHAIRAWGTTFGPSASQTIAQSP